MLNNEIINGSFSPLTLSIFEDSTIKNWRENIKKVENVSVSELLKENEKLSKKIQINEYEATNLTNIHEADHFKRHVSSSLGVMYTLVLLLRHETKKSIIINKDFNNFWLTNSLHVFDDVIRVLFSGDPSVTQEQAVNALNYFYKLFFGIKEKIFVARNPNFPACPGKNFGYKNILEASAIFNEYNYFILKGYDKDTILDFMKKNRDYNLYFWLLDYLNKELRNPCISTIMLRFSLDSYFPLLSAPLTRQVYFDEIHPGWRLLHFTKTYKDEVLSTSEWFKEPEKRENIIAPFLEDISIQYIGGIDRFIKDKFNLYTWNNSIQYEYDSSFSNLISNLGERNKESFTTTINSKINIFKHLFSSYNHFKERKITNTVNFFSPIRIMKELDELRLDEDITKNKYALFSLSKGHFNSMYFDEKSNINAWEGIVVFLENLIHSMILSDTPKVEIINKLLKISTWESQKVQEAYQNVVNSTVEKYYK